MRAVLNAARVEFTGHALRHEFISGSIDDGATVQEAKEMARHKDIKITERYMKGREERLKQLFEKKERRG